MCVKLVVPFDMGGKNMSNSGGKSERLSFYFRIMLRNDHMYVRYYNFPSVVFRV